MSTGPTKIILINAGKYDYAEVEIDEPVHLVGANNAGKTTLISILQYLYIDNEKSLSFSKDYTRTKKYYFKNQYSYILFECMTPKGYMVVGVRGVGALGGTHERFMYEGEYSRDDFFTSDNTVKAGDVVKRELTVNNEYVTLKPSAIQAALTGINNREGKNLGLLPVKNKDGYSKFRSIYKYLLDLVNVGQQEFKDALMYICEGDFSIREGIKVRQRYSQRYDDLCRERDSIADLKKLEKSILKAIAQNEQRKKERSYLVDIYEKISSLSRERLKNNESAREDINEKVDELEERRVAVQGTIDSLKDERDKVIKKIGRLEGDEKDLTKKEKFVQGYAEDLELHIIETSGTNISNLEFRLRQLDVEPVENITKRIRQNKHQLQIFEKRLKDGESLLGAYLKKHYSDKQISTVFSLHNHSLLDLNIESGELTIHDEGEVKKYIDSLLASVNNGVYSTDVVNIQLSENLAPNLSSIIDSEIVEKEIETLRFAIKKDGEILKTAEEKEEVLKKLGDEQELHNSAQDKKSKYTLYKKDIVDSGDIRGQLKKYTKQEQDLSKSLGLEKKNRTGVINELKSQTDLLEKINREEKELLNSVQNLEVPSEDWQIIPSYTVDEDDLDILVKNFYPNTHQEEKALSASINGILIAIQKDVYDSYSAVDEEEVLSKFQQELDALDDKEKTYEEFWRGLLVDITRSISDILKDLNHVKEVVRKFNQKLARIPISDLDGVEIIVEEKSEITYLMNKLVKRSSKLFATGDKEEIPIDVLKQLIESRGEINVSDLFSLSFRVKKKGQPAETYTELKSVESNGTTITIKVLLNLILLKGLFDEKREFSLPFYLDEVGSLDSKNARAIIKQAEELGFTPIIASPDVMNVTSKIYHLKSGADSLKITDQNLLKIRKL